jgi:hypothetical protein
MCEQIQGKKIPLGKSGIEYKNFKYLSKPVALFDNFLIIADALGCQ